MLVSGSATGARRADYGDPAGGVAQRGEGAGRQTSIASVSQIVSLSILSRSCISTLIHRRESNFDWGQRPEGASQLQSPRKKTRQR